MLDIKCYQKVWSPEDEDAGSRRQRILKGITIEFFRRESADISVRKLCG